MFSEKTLSHIIMQGHTPHPDRSTYTHAQFWQEVKDLPKDKEITENGKPIRARLLGRNLVVGDVLPERLALCVDSRGELVRSNDFRDRYHTYLRGFGSNRAPEFEPVPNPKDWLMKQLDPAKPPDNGKAHYVEIGFDTSKQTEASQTGEWHPDGIKMDEWKKKNPDLALLLTGNTASNRDAKVATLIELRAKGMLSEKDLAAELTRLYSETTANIQHETITEPEQAAVEAGPVFEKAPCGKEVKQGYVYMHKRRCTKPECSGVAEQAESAEVTAA